jgi:hypothetical protein
MSAPIVTTERRRGALSVLNPRVRRLPNAGDAESTGSH